METSGAGWFRRNKRRRQGGGGSAHASTHRCCCSRGGNVFPQDNSSSSGPGPNAPTRCPHRYRAQRAAQRLLHRRPPRGGRIRRQARECRLAAQHCRCSRVAGRRAEPGVGRLCRAAQRRGRAQHGSGSLAMQTCAAPQCHHSPKATPCCVTADTTLGSSAATGAAGRRQRLAAAVCRCAGRRLPIALLLPRPTALLIAVLMLSARGCGVRHSVGVGGFARRGANARRLAPGRDVGDAR